MAAPPIPQRIPPLTWRQPAILWTPLALALAIGWPALLFYDDLGPQRLAIVSLFAIFAVALSTLGASWMMGRAPKARRIVVLHVVIAGVIAALIAPFVLTWVLSAVAEGEARESLSIAMSLTMTPLVLVLGLPVVLVSGIVFAWIALKQPAANTSAEDDYRYDVQPFR